MDAASESAASDTVTVWSAGSWASRTTAPVPGAGGDEVDLNCPGTDEEDLAETDGGLTDDAMDML